MYLTALTRVTGPFKFSFVRIAMNLGRRVSVLCVLLCLYSLLNLSLSQARTSHRVTPQSKVWNPDKVVLSESPEMWETTAEAPSAECDFLNDQLQYQLQLQHQSQYHCLRLFILFNTERDSTGFGSNGQTPQCIMHCCVRAFVPLLILNVA